MRETGKGSIRDFTKLNDRFITGGGTATEYKGGDNYYYSRDNVQASGHVLRGGNADADPVDGGHNIA